MSAASKGWTTSWVTGGADTNDDVQNEDDTREDTGGSDDSEDVQNHGDTHGNTGQETVPDIEIKTQMKQEDAGKEKPEDQPSSLESSAPRSLIAEERPSARNIEDENSADVPPLKPLPVEEDGCPSNWATDGWSGLDGFHLIKLRTTHSDYRSIYSEFVKQVKDYKIVQIERLENRDLLDKYQFETARMLRGRPQGSDLNECYLYHGTTVEKQLIASEGLDMRRGKIGFFGRGIYLSDNINKCLQYTSKRTDMKTQLPYVLKCRVLLGDSKVYAKGEKNPNLVTEPIRENPKPGESKYYDSVKGNVLGHDEYVVYNNIRVMPEYIITYTDHSAESSLGGSIKLNTGLPFLTSKPVAPSRTVASLSPTPAVVSPPQTAPLGNVQMEDSKVSLASDGGKRQAVATDSVKDDVDKQTSVTPPSQQSKGNTGTQLSNEFKESLEKGSSRASASRWRDQSATVSQEVLEREQAEYSNEFKENVKASARPQRNTRDAVSQEVLEDQYSEELRQNEAAVSQMEHGKDEPGPVVMGQRLTWHQQDPADHDRRLEAVRDKLQKKHRRFKGKQAKPEDQAPSQVKVAAASHDEQLEEVKQIMRDKRQKDRLAAASAKKEDDTTTDSVQGKNEGSGEVKVVTDKQALQIREYLKTQHKKLQLRKADEESIGKVESLLVAYYQTYGSIESDGAEQSEMKPIAKTGDTTITPGVVGGQDELTQGITARGPPFGAILEPSMASNNNMSSVLRGYIEDDPVDQVLKVQIEQFKECTGVTDDNVAKDFLRKAGLNIDEAVLQYFN